MPPASAFRRQSQPPTADQHRRHVQCCKRSEQGIRNTCSRPMRSQSKKAKNNVPRSVTPNHAQALPQRSARGPAESNESDKGPGPPLTPWGCGEHRPLHVWSAWGVAVDPLSPGIDVERDLRRRRKTQQLLPKLLLAAQPKAANICRFRANCGQHWARSAPTSAETGPNLSGPDSVIPNGEGHATHKVDPPDAPNDDHMSRHGASSELWVGGVGGGTRLR